MNIQYIRARDYYIPDLSLPEEKRPIGAGPAGITAAMTLASQGYGVTIFEWHSQIGGIIRYMEQNG